jgi:hypothetical protein
MPNHAFHRGPFLVGRQSRNLPQRPDHSDVRRRDRRDKVCYLAAGRAMKYDLFIHVALTADLPKPAADLAR